MTNYLGWPNFTSGAILWLRNRKGEEEHRVIVTHADEEVGVTGRPLGIFRFRRLEANGSLGRERTRSLYSFKAQQSEGDVGFRLCSDVAIDIKWQGWTTRWQGAKMVGWRMKEESDG